MMRHLILVHGAWHGPWCWDLITPYLNHYEVHIPSMPGRSLDAHHFQDISLSTYCAVIEKLIASLEGQIILVGHSMGGMTITQIAQKYPDKIAGLIYIAAFIPKHNQNMFDVAGELEGEGIAKQLTFIPEKNLIKIAQDKLTSDYFYNTCSPEQAEKAVHLLCSEPFKAFATKVKMNPDIIQPPKAYLQARFDKALPLNNQTRMMDNTQINFKVTLDTDHSPFISAPKECAKAIEQMIKAMTL